MERPETGTKAEQLRRRFGWLQQFTDEELRDISLCEEGMTLRPGQQYFDLSNPERGVIVPRRGETAGPGSCMVARDQVTEAAWEKLVRMGGTQRRAG